MYRSICDLTFSKLVSPNISGFSLIIPYTLETNYGFVKSKTLKSHYYLDNIWFAAICSFILSSAFISFSTAFLNILWLFSFIYLLLHYKLITYISTKFTSYIYNIHSTNSKSELSPVSYIQIEKPTTLTKADTIMSCLTRTKCFKVYLPLNVNELFSIGNENN